MIPPLGEASESGFESSSTGSPAMPCCGPPIIRASNDVRERKGSQEATSNVLAHLSSLGSQNSEAGKEKTSHGNAIKVAMVLCLALVAACAIRLFPLFLGKLIIVGEEMKKTKGNIGSIILYLVILPLFSAMPLPGRGALCLCLGYVYQWWALPMLIVGQTAGGCVAFMGSRLCWPYLENHVVFLQLCSCCRSRKPGSPNKAYVFLMASVLTIDERPFFTTLLLVWAPVPFSLMSYVLGAKCPSLRLGTYALAVNLGGVRFALPVYLSSKASDLNDLIAGKSPRDPTDVIVLVASFALAAAVSAIVSRKTYLQVQKMQKQEDAAAGIEHASSTIMHEVQQMQKQEDSGSGIEHPSSTIMHEFIDLQS